MIGFRAVRFGLAVMLGALSCCNAYDVTLYKQLSGQQGDASAPNDGVSPQDSNVTDSTTLIDALDASVPDVTVTDTVMMIDHAMIRDVAVVVDVRTDVPPDNPVDVGPSPSTCGDVNAGALFCDGFEDIGLTHWTGEQLMNGSVTRSTTPVYRGLGAVLARTSANMGRADIHYDNLGAINSGDLFFRGYFYFPSGYAIDGISLLYVGETTAPFQRIAVNVANGNQIGTFDGPANLPLLGGSNAILVRDHWMCIEAHVVISGTAGAVDVWLDGALILTSAGFNTLPAAGFSEIGVGAEYTSAMQVPVMVDVDEVVVNRTRIGCN